MSKNAVIILVVVIIILLGGGLLWYRNVKAPGAGAPYQGNEEQEYGNKAPQTGGTETNTGAQSGGATQTQGGTGAAIQTATVIYTKDGFSPKTITVKKGTTVIFKNERDEDMWVASGIHPSHAAYPTTGGCIGSTFDACKGYKKGESWPFKFDIVGTWKYHDHLNASQFGTIVVTK